MPYDHNTAKTRWTISEMKKYRKFVGWPKMLKLVNTINPDLHGHLGEQLIKTEQEQQQAQGAVALIFEAGCRVGEALGSRTGEELQPMRVSDIHETTDSINIIFQLEKRYRKIGGKITKYKATDGTYLRWDTLEQAKASGRSFEDYEGYNTKRLPDIRNIEFSIHEPLVPYMLSWRDTAKSLNWEYLFDLSYNKFYRILIASGKTLGLHFPPHRLRAERATQLMLQADMDDRELKEWFSWQSLKEALNYTTLKPTTKTKMFTPEYLNGLKVKTP